MKRIFAVLGSLALLVGLTGASCRATSRLEQEAFEQEAFARAVIETLRSKVLLGIQKEVVERGLKALIKDNHIGIPVQILLDAAYKLEAVVKKSLQETSETIAQESCLLQDKLANGTIDQKTYEKGINELRKRLFGFGGKVMQVSLEALKGVLTQYDHVIETFNFEQEHVAMAQNASKPSLAEQFKRSYRPTIGPNVSREILKRGYEALSELPPAMMQPRLMLVVVNGFAEAFKTKLRPTLEAVAQESCLLQDKLANGTIDQKTYEKSINGLRKRLVDPMSGFLMDVVTAFKDMLSEYGKVLDAR